MIRPKHYRLVPVEAQDTTGHIVTAALMQCGLCGVVIDTMGGPGEAICEPCAEVVLSGRAQGCIQWGEQ